MGRQSVFERNGKFKCRFCKKYDCPSRLVFNSGGWPTAHHRKCVNEYQRARRNRIKALGGRS